MKANSPILDQPQVIDWDEAPTTATYRLANQDIVFDVDANTDLCDLVWPWAGEQYAKRIALTVSAPREEALMPMVTRLYPGHQELILGTEGVILTKRVAVPRQSEYDRSVIWLLDCQAEGDRLLQLDVEIDWGEPLTQRMVDGLLVAQRNPGPERGIYSQSNAELTCVFGNPQARPTQVTFHDDQRAHLIYHVLVNGMVEVPLLLTVSDVGEQVAWNGFLALRDADRAFELSGKAWETLLKRGRLWTPVIDLNQQIQVAKLAAARQAQRLRTGFATATRQVVESTALIDLTDIFDPTLSRNLLAHLRRAAEATTGRLPTTLPLRPREASADPGSAVMITNGAYLSALRRHLTHHFDAGLLDEHYAAVGLCVTQLMRTLETDPVDANGPDIPQLAADAQQLALWQGDEENATNWWQTLMIHCATEAAQRAIEASGTVPLGTPDLVALMKTTDAPWHFPDLWQALRRHGARYWQGCGLHWQGDELRVEPSWPATWKWWALLDLPYIDDRTLTLVWDGTTLHATQPIKSNLPTQLWERIRTRRTDELEFDLYFELETTVGDEKQVMLIHPEFS